MTPQELKNSILQLAIQGKLVEQKDNETPVKLTNTKQKNTLEFEYEIPDTWQLAHLESVTNSIPSKQYQILESQVQKSGKHIVISQSKDYSIGYSDNAEKLFHHDIPVVVFGDHTTEIKYVVFDFVVGADGVKIFEPLTDYILPLFLYYVFQYNAIGINEMGGYSRHYKFIKDKPIPIPPLAEQKRIVAKIEELLPYIDRYEKAWNRLEDFNKRFPADMQKSILQLAIQGKLVEQRHEEGTGEELYQQIQKEKQALIKAGKIKKEKSLPEITEDEIPFEIPESWKWIRLGDMIEMLTSGSRDWAQYYSDDGDIFLRMGNLSRNSFNLRLDKIQHVKIPQNAEGLRTSLQAGDLLFSITGEVGTLGLIPEGFGKAYINQHTAMIRFLVTLRNKYIPYLLLTDYAQKYYNGNQHGIKNSFRLDSISFMLVPLPPLAEQKRIVAKLEELLPLCERLSSKIRRL